MPSRAYLLDNNILHLVASGDKSVLDRIDALPEEQVCISGIAVREALQGTLSTIARSESRSPAQLPHAYQYLLDLLTIVCELEVFPYTAEAETIFQGFSAKVKRVGTNDCRIAASAISAGMTLVTRDRDFDMVPGVTVQRW